MRRFLLRIFLPWAITLVALYLAFRSLEWAELYSHLTSANVWHISLAVGLTFLSYIFRAWRWEYFFAHKVMTLIQAWRVLILGFFMNNVLPARAGELVRAHAGSKVSGMTRTLILATIASERLADGLTLSLLFVIGTVIFYTPHLPIELSYVAFLFLAVAVGVGALLGSRNFLFSIIEKLNNKIDHKAADYTLSRVKIFINGLSPLYNPKKLPFIIFWSIFIWLIELRLFMSVGDAYGVTIPIQYFVVFLVTVNFSSLIPAAPGGIGVIEAVTSAVLVSVGVDRELALAMVITQHVIQYLVVGIPGAIILLTWKGQIASKEALAESA